jgi:chemotaxis protein MotB
MRNAIDLHEESESNSWIVTFADLVTLLLVFFILLFSVSTVKEDSFEDTINSVKSALKRTGTGSNIGAGAGTVDDEKSEKVETGTVATDSLDPSTQTGDKQQAPTQEQQAIITTPFAIPMPSKQDQENEQKKQDVAKVSQDISNLVKQTATENESKIQSTNDKITINISGDLFFNPGSAQFKREAMPIMDGIGNILRKNDKFTLAIGGHTDNIPISTNRYPSNWELSAIRATTVLRYFVRGGMPPNRLTATGYGQSAPLVPNDSPEQQTENRRIEFVLERK